MRADPKGMDKLRAGRADRISGFVRLAAVAGRLETLIACCESRFPRVECKSTGSVVYNLEVFLPPGV